MRPRRRSEVCLLVLTARGATESAFEGPFPASGFARGIPARRQALVERIQHSHLGVVESKVEYCSVLGDASVDSRSAGGRRIPSAATSE